MASVWVFEPSFWVHHPCWLWSTWARGSRRGISRLLDMLRLRIPCTAAGWARISTLGGAVPASLETSQEFCSLPLSFDAEDWCVRRPSKRAHWHLLPWNPAFTVERMYLYHIPIVNREINAWTLQRELVQNFIHQQYVNWSESVQSAREKTQRSFCSMTRETWIWGVNSSSKILLEIPGMNHCWTKKRQADEFRMNSGLAESYDTVVEILQFDRYCFFHYGSLSQVLINALYNGENGFWGPKPWMINLEWSFSSSLRGPSLWRELQGARHAVSLMAETHTEFLRLLLEQSR